MLSAYQTIGIFGSMKNHILANSAIIQGRPSEDITSCLVKLRVNLYLKAHPRKVFGQ